MIPRTADACKLADWRQALARAVRTPEELFRLLDLPESLLPAAHAAAALFPLRVPHAYVRRMVRGDVNDPLLRQVLPLGDELREVEGFGDDPVGDLKARRARGLLQKYRGRALLLATPACAVHCRFCFRRNYPYGEALETRWREALESLRGDPSIEEMILSGGDPLTLDDGRLAPLVASITALPGVKRLRIHTRLPVVLPERITPSLLEMLATTRLQVVVVAHANHARELDDEVATALAALRGTGATLLAQSVLLRGVNDSRKALAELSERLFDVGVLPYYLHLLDRARGTAHFEVAEREARELMEGLRAHLPGYLVPRLVREEAGAPAKSPVSC